MENMLFVLKMSAIYISWTWTGLPSLYAHAQMAIEQKPTKYSIKKSLSPY